jgi:hypothetical protein
VPDRRRDVRDVLFEADHGENAGEPDRAQVVEADCVFEEGSLDRGAGGRARRVVQDGVEDGPGGLRGKVPVP